MIINTRNRTRSTPTIAVERTIKLSNPHFDPRGKIPMRERDDFDPSKLASPPFDPRSQIPMRKRVSFNESRNESIPNSRRYEDCRASWYTAKEVKKFRANAFFILCGISIFDEIEGKLAAFANTVRGFEYQNGLCSSRRR